MGVDFDAGVYIRTGKDHHYNEAYYVLLKFKDSVPFSIIPQGPYAQDCILDIMYWTTPAARGQWILLYLKESSWYFNDDDQKSTKDYIEILCYGGIPKHTKDTMGKPMGRDKYWTVV